MRIRIPLPYRKGQSLIEILVSVALLSIIIGSVVAIMPGILRTSEVERDQTLAYQYAREGVEQIRHVRDTTASGLTTLQSGTYCLNPDGTMGQTACTKANIGQFKRELTVLKNASECGGQITKVSVTVSWNSGQCSNGAYCNQSNVSTCLNPAYNFLATYVTPAPTTPLTPTPTLTPTVGPNTPTPTKPANTPTPTTKPPTSTPIPPTNTPTPTPIIMTVPVDKDTFIWQQHPTTGYCTAGGVKVVNENAVDTKWGILSFNLKSFVPPAGKTLFLAVLKASVTAGAYNSPGCEQHLHKWSNWGSSCPQWSTDTGNVGEVIAYIPPPATGAQAAWQMIPAPLDSYGGDGLKYINNGVGTNLQFAIRTDQSSGCSNEVDYGSKSSSLTLYYH